MEGDQPPGPGQPQRVLRAWGQDPLEGDGADQQTALRLTPPLPPGIPDPGSGTAPRGEKRVTFECLFRDIMSLNGWVFQKMHVPAANFISPTARVTAAARQAGEEMGGGRPSQTTEEEAGPEQPRDPSAPTAGRKGRGTNRGHGARGAAHEQQVFAQHVGGDIVGMSPCLSDFVSVKSFPAPGPLSTC